MPETPRTTPAAQPGARDSAASDFTSDDQLEITPDDTAGNDFPMCRAIYVGTGGDLVILNGRGRQATWKNVPGGSLVPAKATRVYETDTTAEDLLAVY